jgi:hypothetical protein
VKCRRSWYGFLDADKRSGCTTEAVALLKPRGDLIPTGRHFSEIGVDLA